MNLRFAKMHGLGNDFVVIDAIRQAVEPTAAMVRFLADRHFGVGCDQVLLVEPPGVEGADFRYRIFNADGGEVQQCGNGARCFARFVRDEGLTDKDAIAVRTAAGIIRPRLTQDGQVSVDMGVPRFAPDAIPFEAGAQADAYPLEVAGETVTLGAVSMGNPHAVLRVPDVDGAPVGTLGPALERHPRFPERVNAGFMQVLGRDHVRLRVFERGVGETLACGTGACAAVAVGRRQGLLGPEVRVDLPGGRLRVRWDGEGAPVLMTGPAVRVFDGVIDLGQVS
jgi:diaminopimelate epimerase